MTKVTRRGLFKLLAAIPFVRNLPAIQIAPAPVPPMIAELNAATTRALAPTMVDNFFKSDALIAYIREKGLDKISSSKILSPLEFH